MKKSPLKKSRKKISQDESRNAIADSKSSSASVRKDGKYEAKQAVKEAAGEGPKMKGTPLHNQNKGYESNKQEKSNLLNDNPIASRASGSWMSRHSQSYMPSSSPLQQQGYNDRLDETLGAKDGKNSQSLKDRRNESKGMEKSKGKGAYSSDSKMS